MKYDGDRNQNFSNCRYRLAAIDHGLFSFADLNHNSWPIILITNPKHALFNIPGKEDAKLQIGNIVDFLYNFFLCDFQWRSVDKKCRC